jgi:hypothetical protein
MRLTKPRPAGTGFDRLSPAALALTLGATACANVTIASATALTCTTTRPAARPAGPQAAALSVAGLGLTLCSATFEFVDLWSRRATWGGAQPPAEGDTVLIPAGTSVLLDVSPPRLHMLVLEGSLRFDEDATDELHLQVGGPFATCRRPRCGRAPALPLYSVRCLRGTLHPCATAAGSGRPCPGPCACTAC